ncbi:hypothetical protein BDZ89DRAFT_306518 [Hymenopellis radicata]|nr:hypothetical protein BDZ89DRAFT_306518 [Hymenopellis radicata]
MGPRLQAGSIASLQNSEAGCIRHVSMHAPFKAPFSLTHDTSPKDGPTQSQAVSDTAFFPCRKSFQLEVQCDIVPT